jgi:hypothetical protein
VLKPTIRIQGLVKLADHVRGEIGRGIGGERKTKLQEHVADSVGRIDQILREKGMPETSLASPSRRAYRFLKEIRWDQVPEAASTDSDKPAPVALRWTGLARFAERMMGRLSQTPEAKDLAEIGQAIAQMSRQIERSLEQANAGPEHLTLATRDWRGWFAWLADAQSLAEYVQAIERARRILAPAAREAGRHEPIAIEFRPIRHMWKMHTRGGKLTVVLPTPMVRFDDATFTSLAAQIFHHAAGAKPKVIETMRAEAYQDLATELEALGGIVEKTRGAFYDLAQSFDRVNARYFGGTMARPRLVWSRSFTGRKFGHYDHLKDLVMVSSTLDQERVPQFVLDYLMFHELLHKKHGVRWVNGRGYAHTREFYAEERQFPRYDEADEWLTKLARG